MEEYLKDTVARYKDLYKALMGQDCNSKDCETLLLPEDTQETPMRAPGTFCPWCERPFESASSQDACSAAIGESAKRANKHDKKFANPDDGETINGEE